MLEVMPADDWFNLDLFNADYETPKWPGVSVDTGEMYSDLAMIDGGSNSNTFTTSSPSVVVSEILNLTTSGEKICGRSRNHQQPDGETFGTELRLSVLYYDLGKLLFILRTMPWDMTKVMRLTWVHDTRVNSSEDYQLSLEDNPLAGILKRSADFIKFLKSYHLTKRSKSPVASATAALANDPQSGISDLLATLCCHMLILSIYDCIFQHFIDQYQQNPDPFDSIMQSAPQFQLGGIAIPPQANMLGHLLFTLMESRLRPIELLLGLPDEFCVALRRVPTDEDADDGLFSSQSSQSLFAALMHVEAERETGEVHGIGVIKSLREKVGHAQALK